MPTAPPSIPKSKSKALPMVMIAIGIIAIIGLAFYYTYRNSLLSDKAPMPHKNCGDKDCKSNEECRTISAPNGDTRSVCVLKNGQGTSNSCPVPSNHTRGSGIAYCAGVPYEASTHVCMSPCPDEGDIARRILFD
jgi:hypothetical protein